MTKKIVKISAGLSEQSSTDLLADKIFAAVNARITSRGEDIEVVDIKPQTIAKDLLNAIISSGVNSPALDTVKNSLSEADGLIAVTPVYAASFSSLFKLFFDILDPDSLNGIPTIIGATAGTPRHSLVLDYSIRPLLTYFRAHVVPTGIFFATEDFAVENAMADRLDRAACEFTELALIEKEVVGGFVPNLHDEERLKLRRKSGTTIKNDTVPNFWNLLGKSE